MAIGSSHWVQLTKNVNDTTYYTKQKKLVGMWLLLWIVWKWSPERVSWPEDWPEKSSQTRGSVPSSGLLSVTGNMNGALKSDGDKSCGFRYTWMVTVQTVSFEYSLIVLLACIFFSQYAPEKWKTPKFLE